MTILKGNCHNFGFRPFGVINRAVVLNNAYGQLPLATPVVLGQNWRWRVTVRQDASGPGYVCGWQRDAATDANHIIYGFISGEYELFCPDTTAGAIRVSLVAKVLDSLFHDIEFSYDGTTIRCYLDGVLKNSVAIANVTFNGYTQEGFLVGMKRAGSSIFTGAISSLVIESATTAQIDFSFNEAAGNAINTGTIGGQMIFSDGGPRQTI